MDRPADLETMLTRCTAELALPGVSVTVLGDDPDQLTSAGRVLGDAFAERESMTSLLVEREPSGAVGRATREMAVGVLEEIAPLGYSVAAVDAAGEVVGLLLSAPCAGEEFELPPALEPVSRVLNELTRALNDHTAALPERPELLEIVMVATETAYLGRGLMRHLCKATTTLARQHGFTGLVTEATSNSQIIFARHMGMETIATVSYAEIPEFAAIPERRMSDHHPPITHARLMWAPIERAEQFEDVAGEDAGRAAA